MGWEHNRETNKTYSKIKQEPDKQHIDGPLVIKVRPAVRGRVQLQGTGDW